MKFEVKTLISFQFPTSNSTDIQEFPSISLHTFLLTKWIKLYGHNTNLTSMLNINQQMIALSCCHFIIDSVNLIIWFWILGMTLTTKLHPYCIINKITIHNWCWYILSSSSTAHITPGYGTQSTGDAIEK